MSKYTFLKERYARFSKYTGIIALIFLIIFLIVTAINTGNEVLSIISTFTAVIWISCAIESAVLYVLSKVLR